jgi:hypothetical protein
MPECTPAGQAERPEMPQVGAVMVDGDGRLCEFRGETYGFWYLRPLLGGREWTVRPGGVVPADEGQRREAEAARARLALRVAVLHANARSRDVRQTAGGEPR